MLDSNSNSLPDDLRDALQWRYAVKKMDPSKSVSENKIAALLDAIQYAPTSSGTQPFKVFVITNDDLRTKSVRRLSIKAKLPMHRIFWCSQHGTTTPTRGSTAWSIITPRNAPAHARCLRAIMATLRACICPARQKRILNMLRGKPISRWASGC